MGRSLRFGKTCLLHILFPFVILSKWVFFVDGVKRSPFNPEILVVKRIVALEGDEVATKPPYPFSSEVVPFGHVWVEGENPNGRKSLDSNTYGPIGKNLIVGQLKAVVWPWSQASWIRWQDYRESQRVFQNKFPVEIAQIFKD